MSKPSTTPTPKVSTRPPRKPASAKRHPQAETSISTSSKSSQSLTSPSKNATNQLDQKDIATMDGINIPPRGSIGALKSNSVTSGSTNEDSTMLSTYPANASPAKTEDIKSFEPVLVESRGGMPLPSLWNQQASSSSFKQSGSTSNPPHPTHIPPAAAKLIAPSLPDTGSPASKVDVLALSPAPSRKVKKLTSKVSKKPPSSSLSITPQKNLDPAPPAPLSTAFPTPSSGFMPASQNPQDNVSAFNSKSSFATARIIEDLSRISYPEGVTGPKPELNVNSTSGRFRYNREFLLQFMTICTEKPEVPLGIIHLDFSTRTSNMTDQSKPAQSVPRSKRKRSKRGGERNQSIQDQVAKLEPVAPREVSGNGAAVESLTGIGHDVERKVRALLNKLTMENFDNISDQIIAWANKSEREKDCRTLAQVTGFVFENAANEAAWSGIYAKFCRKMMEKISPHFRDDSTRNAEGKPLAGGQLFRKYLMDRCWRDFNCGWAARIVEDLIIKKAAGAPAGSRYLASSLYAVPKAKRRRLALIQFYGELYKLQMSTEHITHECVKKLLGYADVPGEAEFESLHRLLMTVGKLLDTPKARAHMDSYFMRMKELGESNKVTPRVKFIVQDLVDLRERNWVYAEDRSKDNGGDGVPQVLLEGGVNGKIAEDVEELFSARNINESEEYFKKLPSEYHHRLVGKMVSKVIESKEPDGKLVADAFARAVEKNVCSISAFEEGFLPVAEFLDDTAIDAPNAFQIMATVMRGAGLDKDDERRARIAQRLTNSGKLLGLLA